MIHDIEICKECHYMKIENLSCRERHCRKCDNYGEKMLPATLTIIQRPVEVNFECPHCHEDIEIEIDEVEWINGISIRRSSINI